MDPKVWDLLRRIAKEHPAKCVMAQQPEPLRPFDFDVPGIIILDYPSTLKYPNRGNSR